MQMQASSWSISHVSFSPAISLSVPDAKDDKPPPCKKKQRFGLCKSIRKTNTFSRALFSVGHPPVFTDTDRRARPHRSAIYVGERLTLPIACESNGRLEQCEKAQHRQLKQQHVGALYSKTVATPTNRTQDVGVFPAAKSTSANRSSRRPRYLGP